MELIISGRSVAFGDFWVRRLHFVQFGGYEIPAMSTELSTKVESLFQN